MPMNSDDNSMLLASKFGNDFYTSLRSAFTERGPHAAADELIHRLQTQQEYQQLFYAYLLKARLDLGVSPFPLGPAAELPTEAHAAYEQAIRHAGRTVGTLLLEQREIAKAWPYFRMLQEVQPIREAILNYQPSEADDMYPVIDIAWQQGVAPEKGFDLVLDRSGICSAITMVSSSDFSTNPALRQYCVARLVVALHAQLRERILADLQARQADGEGETKTKTINPNDSIPAWLAQFPDLTANEAYHIDLSHLMSVVSFAIELGPCPELQLARELALYGCQLSEQLLGRNDPPFENNYHDYLAYLNVLADVDRAAGLAHFQAKVGPALAEGYQYPAEVLVNLYLKVGKPAEALAIAREHLREAQGHGLTCPGMVELARLAADYQTLCEQAAANDDPVQWLAGLISQRSIR